MCELLLARAWRTHGLPPLPRLLRVPLINAALVLVAGPLFFGEADRAGLVARCLVASSPLLSWLPSLVPGLQPVARAVDEGAAAWEARGAFEPL